MILLLIHFITYQLYIATGVITISLIPNWNIKIIIRKYFYNISTFFGIKTTTIIQKCLRTIQQSLVMANKKQ